MIQNDLIRDVLKKYKFDSPVPDNIRKEVLKSKKKTLVKILKEKGKLTLYVSLVLSFFFWIKRIGFTVTVAKSAAIVFTSGIITAGVILGGVTYGVKKGIFDILFQPDEKIEKKNEDKKAVSEKKDKAEIINYRLSIVPFKITAEDQKIGWTVNALMKNELVRIKGISAANYIGKIPRENRPKKMLTGSIIKFGNLYRISAKVIDSSNSQIIMYASENAKGENDMKRACRELAKKIAPKI